MKPVHHLGLGWILGLLTASGVAAAGHLDVFGRLDAAQAEAATIDRLARGLRDRDARQRIEGAVDRLQGQLTALGKELRHPGYDRDPRGPGHDRDPRRPGWDPGPPPEVVAVPVVYVVDDRELGEMKRALGAAPFSADKLALLDDLRLGRHFTSAQVLTLVEVFAFSGDRVEAAARLHPHVVDPERFWTVVEAMTFSSDKEALRRRLTP